MKKYYSLCQEGSEATIHIYGDIVSWVWFESDVSSYTLSKELDGIDADAINVYINSYGGEVAEGLAIYNSLKRHKAKVRTVCDGFACSAASVVFMAGDERIMNPASLLMIHNAWTSAQGNSAALRKEADDLDAITQASVAAYLADVTISEDRLKELMDNETWISPVAAVEMGFATGIADEGTGLAPSQSARHAVMDLVLNRRPTAQITIDPDLIAEAVTKKLLQKVEQQETRKPIHFLNALSRGKE